MWQNMYWKKSSLINFILIIKAEHFFGGSIIISRTNKPFQLTHQNDLTTVGKWHEMR